MRGAGVRGAEGPPLPAGRGRHSGQDPQWELAPWTGVGRRYKPVPETVCEVTRHGGGRRL